MKLLANENIPKYVCDNLNKIGIDTTSVSDLTPGANDKRVTGLAIKEGRIVLTFDKDFGELVFKQKALVKGIILLRFSPKSPQYIFQKLKTLFESKEIQQINNSFLVVEENRVRIRKIR